MKPFQKQSIRRNPEESIRKWSFSDVKKPPKKEKKATSLTRIFFWTFLLIATAGAFSLSALLLIVLKDLPPIDDERTFAFSESTILYDRDGKEQLYAVHGDQNRKQVSIADISQNMILAILAAEDDQFYTHTGFDLGGISMAFCHEIIGNLNGLCPPRGGSTLTQQLVKNFFLTPERTLTRKLKEVVLSYKLEKHLSKDQILELYLNGISFGSNFHGVEIAGQSFFRTSAKNLSAAQGAILAALAQAPSRYSPFGERAYSILPLDESVIKENNLETLQQVAEAFPDAIDSGYGLVGQEVQLANGKTDFFDGRADWVLKRMRNLNYISKTAYQRGKTELAAMTFDEHRESMNAPHFVIWVKQQLEEEFGPELVERGGLKVQTTIDMELQRIAETVVEDRAAINAEQFQAENAALIAIEPNSGEIKAMVGSADYWNEEIDGKVNVILKKRLPGSSFKPITYAAAFLAGKLSPARVLFDVETDFGNGWKPQNFDGMFRGPVSVRNALGNSLNIPAVKAAIIAGPDKVYELATKIGISFDREPDFYGAAIALGGAEARPIDMAVAFSVFANGGKKIQPKAILRVEDRFGNILFSAEDNAEEPEQALDAAVAYQVTDMLSDPAARGPGWNSRLQLDGRKNIVKTGTADKKVNDTPWPADCWTIGAIPQLTTAVWVGNSGGEVMGRKASGFEVAAPIWHKFMSEAGKNLSVEEFKVPNTVKRVQVSRLSGLLPVEGINEGLITSEIFGPQNVPQVNDSSLGFIEIDRISGKLPTDLTPESSKEKRAILSMHSYYPNNPNWETPVQLWLAKNKESVVERYGITDEILTESPKEFDDVHTTRTAANAPDVDFTSPKKDDLVSPPRSTILLDILALNGFKNVAFFWNDRLIKSFETEDPTGYVIPIPPSSTGTNVIRVEVTDRLDYSSSSEISVKVGEDTSAPEVAITYPRNGEVISGGSKVTLTADASDRLGAIQKVEFYLDDKRLGAGLFFPYKYEWDVPNVDGEHEITVIAKDLNENEAEDTRRITIKERPVSKEFGISSPADGAIADCSDAIVITAGVAGKTRDEFKSLEIWGDGESKAKTLIASFDALSENGFFETSFSPETCGVWKFYAKASLKDGPPRVSSRTTITFSD